MSVKQISVFIENKKGRVKNAVNALSTAGINIRALSIADNAKYGILRLIVSDDEKAKEILEKENFIVKENKVILIRMKDEPNSLNSVLELFECAKINIEYIYAFISSKIDEAIVVIKIKDYETGLALLKEQNANLLTKEDIDKL